MPHTEPIVLTLFDFAMIIGVVTGLILVPTLLWNREFRNAGKAALMVLGVLVTNLALHAAASLLHI
jgi:hypothetical protein